MYAQWALARGDAGAARASRTALRLLIADAEIPAPIDEVDVILGELASNAIRYGRDPMWIAVVLHNDLLAFCTYDCGLGYDLDQKLAVSPTGENGRGLRIVKAFSTCVTVNREPSGEFCVCVSIAL